MTERRLSRYIAGLVTYDGTEYHGFQSQVDVPTIQDALEDALGAFVGIDGRLSGSGRTDTGVHASGQVVAVRVAWHHELAALQRAWNHHLPASIAVRHLQNAPSNFHPRFSAVARTYRYTIVDEVSYSSSVRSDRSPLTDRFALFVPERLNVERMQTAGRLLVGRHDFAAFGQPPQGENSVRTVMSAEWHVVQSSLPVLQDTGQRQIVFTIRADAFLRRMVRNIVGALLEVGRGRWSPDEMGDVLLSRDRGRCASPAPPQGLVLERVDYPTHYKLEF